jgi:hypothetical protein
MPGAIVVAVIMHTTTTAPSTGKVRRDTIGGKRGNGHAMQARGERVRRPDAEKITFAGTRERLTSTSGLVAFARFLRKEGVDRQLRQFDQLKTSPQLVYPMHAQMRLLLDAHVAGESRVFGVEALSADPLFVRLAGGTVPSIDTIYRDLGRFDPVSIDLLESMMANWGLDRAALRGLREVNLDIDTTVEELHGDHEGGAIGYNPRCHGRPSYHPIVARLAELDTCIGALLRRGDTSFGKDDVETVRKLVRRVKEALTPKQELCVRIDAAGDCTDILSTIAEEKALFLTKARMTSDLVNAIAATKTWRTVDTDAMDEPQTQVADIEFQRKEWVHRDLCVRVIAVRTKEPRSGKQLLLWPDSDYTVKAYLTNSDGDALDLSHRYEDRAGIETLIAEWKGGWGIAEQPCWGFDANHAAFLLKLLAHNLVRRFVAAVAPALADARWRIEWLRRALINVAGQLVQSGRQWLLRVPLDSQLARLTL